MVDCSSIIHTYGTLKFSLEKKKLWKLVQTAFCTGLRVPRFGGIILTQLDVTPQERGGREQKVQERKGTP